MATDPAINLEAFRRVAGEPEVLLERGELRWLVDRIDELTKENTSFRMDRVEVMAALHEYYRHVVTAQEAVQRVREILLRGPKDE
jgi:hypothetical protein